MVSACVSGRFFGHRLPRLACRDGFVKCKCKCKCKLAKMLLEAQRAAIIYIYVFIRYILGTRYGIYHLTLKVY